MARLLAPLALLTQLALLVILVLLAVQTVSAGNITNNSATNQSQSSGPKLCHLKSLNSSSEEYEQYKRCLQANIDILLPFFSNNTKITETFSAITSIINNRMQSPDRQQGIAIPLTTRKTLNNTRLEIVSIKHNALLFKVLLPKLEDTPTIGNGTRNETVECASDTTNVTMEGPLAMEKDTLRFVSVIVRRIDAVISEFAAAQNQEAETVSLTKTTVSEEGNIPLNKEVLEVMNIVFGVAQGDEQGAGK